jgi:hypothetical protein
MSALGFNSSIRLVLGLEESWLKNGLNQKAQEFFDYILNMNQQFGRIPKWLGRL